MGPPPVTVTFALVKLFVDSLDVWVNLLQQYFQYQIYQKCNPLQPIATGSQLPTAFHRLMFTKSHRKE